MVIPLIVAVGSLAITPPATVVIKVVFIPFNGWSCSKYLKTLLSDPKVVLVNSNNISSYAVLAVECALNKSYIDVPISNLIDISYKTMSAKYLIASVGSEPANLEALLYRYAIKAFINNLLF